MSKQKSRNRSLNTACVSLNYTFKPPSYFYPLLFLLEVSPSEPAHPGTEYFPFLSPPSCFISYVSAHMGLTPSLFMSWWTLTFGFLLVSGEVRREGLRVVFRHPVCGAADFLYEAVNDLRSVGGLHGWGRHSYCTMMSDICTQRSCG